MTQHSQNGEGVEAGLRNLLTNFQDIAAMHPNDQPHYKGGARQWGGGDLIDIIATLQGAIKSLAREPATADVGREWPDIGTDPMKGDRRDRIDQSIAACRAAYTVQQKHVPDQTALVWRWHLGALLEYATRLKAMQSRAAPSSDHSDDAAVDRFAAQMKAKLAKARAKGRGGWDDPAQCSTDHLRRLLHDHLPKGDPIDVPNFCMMLAHYGASTAAPSSEPAIAEGERVEWFVIRRHGAFFRPDAAGYTTHIGSAGFYTREQADKYADVEGVTIGKLTDWQAEALTVIKGADRLRAALATTPPTTNDAIPAGDYVAGPVHRLEDEVWSAEVQVTGGYYVAATVYGSTKSEARSRQKAIIATLSAAPSAPATEAGEEA